MSVFYKSMVRRAVALMALAIVSVLALGGFALTSFGAAQTIEPHISFVLATGSTGGTYFPVGQAIAEIISHPPGVTRCDTIDACGPPGLIASTRSSLGSVANLLDVNAGRADSGLAQSDIVAEAIAGAGDFRSQGPLKHVRMIADLFPEEVHLVAARASQIRTVSDLKGKRVALGAKGSGSAITAREILAAYRVPERRVKIVDDAPESAARELESGNIDAFFFVGGAPVEFINGLIQSGKAVLVPIDGAGRDRLLYEHPGMSIETIESDDYPGLANSVGTIGVHAVWIVNENEPTNLVYRITKALFSPANRELLYAAHPSARAIRAFSATRVVPAPLHPGAQRYYHEIGASLTAQPLHGN